jgi:hypothetical protein
MELGTAARRESRLVLFVVLVTALVIWALTQKGLAALPLLALFAAPHLFSAGWQHMARRYDLPRSAPDKAYLAQLLQWRRDRKQSGLAQRPPV